MARLARVVLEGVAHHVTQRGNRRQQVFFGDDDYRAYRTLLAAGCRDAGVEVEVWAYCLMPNHVHLILTPTTRDGLRAALAESHRRYTRAINLREGWRGYLWQGRFASVAMDEAHTMAAARYVELNPVRARLARRADEWPWSSARAHLDGRGDGMVDVRPLLAREANWSGFLDQGLDEGFHRALQSSERTGRPLGSDGFMRRLEAALVRSLTPKSRGRSRSSEEVRYCVPRTGSSPARGRVRIGVVDPLRRLFAEASPSMSRRSHHSRLSPLVRRRYL